jgi:hypothetical protein
VTTPEGKPPVENPDGSTTLPGGGTVKTPGGTEIDVPGGTTIDKDGNTTIPNDGEGTVKTPGGAEIDVPGGTTIDDKGTVKIPNDKEAGVTLPDGGTTIALPGGTTIDDKGTVKIPSDKEAEVTLPDGGTTIALPGGTTIDDKGIVTVGEGKAKINTPGGWTFNVGEGSIIILDADTPLGYRIGVENPFTDVGEDAWYYDNVVFVYTHGLFEGTSGTTFSPNTPMTRGMLVTVLARLSGADLSKYTNGSFADVDANEYYAASVAWARDMGIVSGTGGNNFAPNTEVSRQDFAVIVARFADFADKQLPETRPSADFLDSADVADYAKDAIEAFFKAGIVSGRPGNLFDPKGQATRAEVAAILHRFIDKTENTADKH